MTPTGITMTVRDGVADIHLARPEKLNALDLAAFDAIGATIDAIARDAAIRCVVLSGDGRAFCAGIDLATLGGADALRDLAPRTHGIANRFQHAAWGWRALPQPVIAAVHGVAFGAGFQIMLAADVRICAPDATLAMMEARWGLVPDLGGIALLRGLVRDDVAREITYTGRRIDGREAATLGIVTRLADDPRGEAMATARAIAAASPDAIRAAKRLFNHAADADAAAILAAESREQATLLASGNHAEALAAAGGRRPPRFVDGDNREDHA